MSTVDGTWDFFVQGITIGDTVTLNSNRGTNGLPEIVTCMIFTSENSEQAQEFVINLSADDELYLQDSFGSFQLEACNMMDCMVEVAYEYTVVNTGNTIANVTSFVRERDGDILDLLASGLLEPTLIGPGSSGSASETELINYCQDSVYFTKVDVDAIPPTGLSCPASATYEFEVMVGCRVDVDITCVSEFGVECQSIESPEGTCGVAGAIDVLQFVYIPTTCEDSVASHNQPNSFCEDLEAIPDGETVVVNCFSDVDGSSLIIDRDNVNPGDGITITSPSGGNLPDKIKCTIGTETNEPESASIYQQSTFFTTNGDDGAPLKVKDQFGSLELVSCTDEDGSGVNCIQVVQYIYDINNAGVNDMNLNDLERTRNNDTISLIDLVGVTNLKPGESVQVRESDIIDICEASTFETQVSVNANPQNGISCFDEDTYTFEITPPCELSQKMKCSTPEGLDCASNLVGEEFVECRCADSCANELIYRYTAATAASVVFQSDGSTFFSGTVQAGDDIVVSNNMECLPSEFQVTVAIDGQASQEVTIDASCGSMGMVTLLETFGAFEFAGYTCSDGEPHNCYVNVEFEVATSATGTVGQTITEWAFVLNDEVVPPSAPLPTIEAGEEFIQVIQTEVELCVNTQYQSTTMATGIGEADRQPCIDSDSYFFNIVVGSPFPTTSPSNAPSATPSASPSASPSSRPSESPTVSPSASPSDSPSSVPSLSPSISASTSPSSSPSVAPSASPSSSPSDTPSDVPSFVPSSIPTTSPSAAPSVAPSDTPTRDPSVRPTTTPSSTPSDVPSSTPSMVPSASPSDNPSIAPSLNPSAAPSDSPSSVPTISPSATPSDSPSAVPSFSPSTGPSSSPTASPSTSPSDSPSDSPSLVPSFSPSATPSDSPSSVPSLSPSTSPSSSPTASPSTSPSDSPSDSPSSVPSFNPSAPPSDSPSSVPSLSPSTRPSSSPTASPSISPSDTPSDSPSSVPSPSPSASPSVSPSATPSDSPSSVPSHSPSTSPSSSPTASPSTSPSDTPSDSPSGVPSLSPSASPSSAPSSSPTIKPTLTPTEEFCEFDLEITCVPPPGSDSCNATPPPVEQCTGRPFEMVFLFNGGDCEQSFNVQEASGKFFCEDFNGGPPTKRGEKAFIVVTALKDDTVYHNDWVVVGDLFTLFDEGNNFVADQLITIYGSDNVTDPSNILQAVQYHSSCSSNLFLKDRFGATQLVIWVNEDQGTVSCFANQTFELDITVPIDIVGGPATITSLTVASNVDPFFFNLTDKVAGVEVDAGETLSVSIAIPIDLTQKQTYNLLVTIAALTSLGQQCRATDLVSFTAGYPLPPIFPTFAPTTAPTGIPPRDGDPETAICNLEADIDCRGSSGETCRSLRPPAGGEAVQDTITLTYRITNEGGANATVTSAVKTLPNVTELLTNGDVVLGFGGTLEFTDTATVNLVPGGQVRYDFFVAGKGTISNGECFDDESYIF